MQEKLLTPFQIKLLQESLQDDLPEHYRQRIEIMLLADQGKSQTQICKTLGCSQGTARYWIALARAGQAHNWNVLAVGRPKTINDQYLERLKELVSYSPRNYGYPFGRWTAQWLSKHLAKELGIEVSNRYVNQLLREMGLSTRPRCEKEQAVDANKTRIAISDLNCSSPELSWLFNPINNN